MAIKNTVSINFLSTFLNSISIFDCHLTVTWSVNYSTANIKVLRGSLGALSVNKLSHIPKLQPISAVYENQ